LQGTAAAELTSQGTAAAEFTSQGTADTEFTSQGTAAAEFTSQGTAAAEFTLQGTAAILNLHYRAAATAEAGEQQQLQQDGVDGGPACAELQEDVYGPFSGQVGNLCVCVCMCVCVCVCVEVDVSVGVSVGVSVSVCVGVNVGVGVSVSVGMWMCIVGREGGVECVYTCTSVQMESGYVHVKSCAYFVKIRT